ncbi:MAG TPA: hypothetical protein VJ874_01135 [Candidatus Thermoplasmatota archaeon]|nr:hypothetical protein [Candidatus Thermoplasmatota archaeon]
MPMICKHCGRDWYAETRVAERFGSAPGAGSGGTMHACRPNRVPITDCPIHKTPLVHGYCSACFAHVRRTAPETET